MLGKRLKSSQFNPKHIQPITNVRIWHTMTDTYLAGDIGGTKTILALYTREAGPDHPFDREVFLSRDFSSLEQIIQAYLAKRHTSISEACFGVAGPVKDERVQATNLPWVIETNNLTANLNSSKIWLLNDLIATAKAVPYLTSQDIHVLKSGVPATNGAVGIVAPGTGLGESILVWNAGRYIALPSEGGHSNFGPTNTFEIGLLSYLQHEIGHVSYESVCSGMGIPNLYAYLRNVHMLPEPDWLREELENAPDAVPIIASAALEHKSEICERTMRLFISILGNEAGNLALNVFATGGIYISGGIPPRILPLIDRDAFIRAFINKGRFERLLAEIPVYVILKADTALFGAACHIFEQVGAL